MTRPKDRLDAGSQLVQPWWLVVGGLAVIAIVGALVGLGGNDEPDTSAAATSTSRSPASPSAAPSTTPSQPAPSSAVPSTTSAAPATTVAPSPTTAGATTSGVDFVMPDLVGLDLQSAQNAVQDLGAFYSVSHDLLGSRNQVIDSSWVVCDQNVAPGQRVTGDVEGEIDFGVVKREERCP